MEPINDLLQDIALHIWEGEHGAFLQDFAGIYFHANEEQKKILRPAWQTFIEEYLVKNHGVVQEEG